MGLLQAAGLTPRCYNSKTKGTLKASLFRESGPIAALLLAWLPIGSSVSSAMELPFSIVSS